MKKKLRIVLLSLAALLVIDLLMPTKIQNPVEGCGMFHINPIKELEK